MKNSYITVTDQFCGAGGSSQGVRNVSLKNKGGVEVRLALNHWKLAIDTHNTNFPDTLHDCTDVSACDPRRYPSTDILITSPECTNHSLAKGQKIVKSQIKMFDEGKIDPAAERSRATMWDVCRFTEYHNYNIIIVENVVDARKWVMWDSWLMAMHSLGYNHKCVYANSMHFFPTPQSRDRLYIVFWKKGNKAPDLEHTPLAYCSKCGNNVHAIQTWKKPGQHFGKYRMQYIFSCPVDGVQVEPYYYASFNCIDWSDRGQRIGDRIKPLSPNTTKRIKYGLDKYGEFPYIIHAAYSDQARGTERSTLKAAFAQTTLQSQAIVNPPFIINDQHSSGIDCRVKGMGDSNNTILAAPHFKVIFPPFVVKGEHTKKEFGYVKNSFETIQTQTVRQSMMLVTPPMIIEANSTGKAKPITLPASTFTAGGINQGLLTSESWNSFISSYYNTDCTKHFTEEIGTVTTSDRHALIQYNKPTIEECYYRMLKSPEIQRAMAFDNDYVVLGSSKDQVKQLGNAVTPPVMEWLVERCIESLD